jgi:hypothetical protein
MTRRMKRRNNAAQIPQRPLRETLRGSGIPGKNEIMSLKPSIRMALLFTRKNDIDNALMA